MSETKSPVFYSDWKRAARMVLGLWVLGTVAVTLFVLGVTDEDITLGSVARTVAVAAIVLGVPGLLFIGLTGVVDLLRARSHRG